MALSNMKNSYYLNTIKMARTLSTNLKAYIIGIKDLKIEIYLFLSTVRKTH